MVRTAVIVTLALFLAVSPSAQGATGKTGAVATAGGGASKADEATRTQVQAFVKTYIEAANRADVTAMMEMVRRRPDVSSVTDGVISRGWEQIREDSDQFAGKEGTYHLALGAIDVTPLGAEYALAVAPIVVSVVVGQATIQAGGALTIVVEKSGGKWLLLHEHMSGQEPEQDQDLGPGDDDQDPGPDEGE